MVEIKESAIIVIPHKNKHPAAGCSEYNEKVFKFDIPNFDISMAREAVLFISEQLAALESDLDMAQYYITTATENAVINTLITEDIEKDISSLRDAIDYIQEITANTD